MLAKILFNLTFIASLIAGILSAIKWGIAYTLPVAFAVFFIGVVATFLLGVAIGAKDGIEP